MSRRKGERNIAGSNSSVVLKGNADARRLANKLHDPRIKFHRCVRFDLLASPVEGADTNDTTAETKRGVPRLSTAKERAVRVDLASLDSRGTQRFADSQSDRESQRAGGRLLASRKLITGQFEEESECPRTAIERV